MSSIVELSADASLACWLFISVLLRGSTVICEYTIDVKIRVTAGVSVKIDRFINVVLNPNGLNEHSVCEYKMLLFYCTFKILIYFFLIVRIFKTPC